MKELKIESTYFRAGDLVKYHYFFEKYPSLFGEEKKYGHKYGVVIKVDTTYGVESVGVLLAGTSQLQLFFADELELIKTE